MPKAMSSDDAYEIATRFRALAKSVGDYLFENWRDLTARQRTQLEGLEYSLRNTATDFISIGIKAALDDVEGTVKEIKTATDDIKRTIGRLKSVGEVINVATRAVTLGAALLSQNPTAIASAIDDAIKGLG